MCAFEGKVTTHSQFLASAKFRVALRETYLGHRQIIEICVVRCAVFCADRWQRTLRLLRIAGGTVRAESKVIFTWVRRFQIAPAPRPEQRSETPRHN